MLKAHGKLKCAAFGTPTKLSGWAAIYFSVIPVLYKHVWSLMKNMQLDQDINNLSRCLKGVEENFCKSAMPCSIDLLFSSVKAANKN